LIQKETPVELISKYFVYKINNLNYRPDMVLSIIGNIKWIDEEIKTLFKQSIIKSRILDTWILTGGINEGVDELIGEAIDEDLNTNFLPVFGITNLNKLSLKDELHKSSPQSNTVCFILK
jgi:hypothetical protein